MNLPGVSRLVKRKILSSTQDEARLMAKEGAADGTLVWALRQTSGRGRMQRRWSSSLGGLYVTWLLRPKFPPARLADFSLACGAAAAAALRDVAGIETAIKPPNDVLARGKDGRLRKVCGILCEASGGSNSLDWLAVGVGINVNNDPPLKLSTSLRSITGRRLGLAVVLNALMDRLTRVRRSEDFI